MYIYTFVYIYIYINKCMHTLAPAHFFSGQRRKYLRWSFYLNRELKHAVIFIEILQWYLTFSSGHFAASSPILLRTLLSWPFWQQRTIHSCSMSSVETFSVKRYWRFLVNKIELFNPPFAPDLNTTYNRSQSESLRSEVLHSLAAARIIKPQVIWMVRIRRQWSGQ